MRKFLIILLLLIPAFLYGEGTTETYKSKKELYEAMEKVADNYSFVFIRYESFPMMTTKDTTAYGQVPSSIGPSFIYVRNETNCIAFIFTNDGRLFDNPSLYFCNTWKNWFNYYVNLDKPKLQNTSIAYDVDTPEAKLLKEMNTKKK